MNPAMPPEQAVILLRFLFARTRTTVGQPAPVLRWLYEPADTIRGDLNRGDGVQLDGLDNDGVLPTLGDLKIILNWFLARQPVMTRAVKGLHFRRAEPLFRTAALSIAI